MKRWARWLTGILVVAVVAGGAFWAGRLTLRAPTPIAAEGKESLLTDVTTQKVGKTLRFNVTVTRERTPVAINALAGVVTQASESGVFDNGGVVYAVGGTPVRVVAGPDPYYRDLARDVSGTDVAQLRETLRHLGYLSTQGGKKFDQSTEKAVKAWQKDLGQEPTGVIGAGELVAVPSLPAILTLDEKVWKGAVLAGGEELLFVNAGTPTFVMELGSNEASQVPSDAEIEIVFGQSTWTAVITGQRQTPEGSIQLELAALDGGVVCGDQCDQLPADQQATYLLFTVSVVPPVSGPAIPVAAVVTRPDGTTVVTVVDDQGVRTERAVAVLGSQEGVAVVDGLVEGERVQVFGAGAQPAGQPSATKSGR
ncbi:MAG: peptidoglycan-binding protein [Propionibacteriaceae bacterium]|jgi:peptidoglycan hydrolase-like protein with peptidoglycan-binding domain|nr:peptidoglycan-binding protein [Propionibacteriaceae bacterium]